MHAKRTLPVLTLALRLLSVHSKSSAREAQQAAQEAQELFKRLGVDPSLV